MPSGNKGEWSELYVFFKLLAEGRLYAADSNLNRIADLYYPVIRILRKQTSGNYDYLINGEIKILDPVTNQILVRVPLIDFTRSAELLLTKIQQSQGNFDVDELEEFLRTIKCTQLKAVSTNKADINLVLHDIHTGIDGNFGFSIKSRLGSPSTLLNSSQATNFTFRIEGNPITTDFINQINQLNRFRDKISLILANQSSLIFEQKNDENFQVNLQMIDSQMPLIIATLLLKYYSGNDPKLSELVVLLNEENPCGFNLTINSFLYESKIKALLTGIALGMTPTAVWNGKFDASGGYIVVKENGEVLCYHIYNYNEFQDYLLANTKLDTPSTSRHSFGEIFFADGIPYFKLNLQIRFLN